MVLAGGAVEGGWKVEPIDQTGVGPSIRRGKQNSSSSTKIEFCAVRGDVFTLAEVAYSAK